MAGNTVFKLRRSSVAGKKPTTSDIAIGEQALNLTDRILYSSDGTNIWEIGANNTTVNVTNSITVATNSITNSSGIFTTNINAASHTVGTSAFVANTSGIYTNNNINLTNNNKGIKFTPLAGGSNVALIQQSDDNFVFYSTNTTNGQRAIFNVYANTNSNVQAGAFRLNVPLDMASQPLYANGSAGSGGQVLASNGSALYWTTVGGTGTVTSVGTGTGLTGGPVTTSGTISVNTGYDFTWTNNHTFSANVSVTGSGIAVASNTGSVYFGGISDANWRISRNAGITTKFFYTNNSLDIIAASSPKEGIVFGWTGNSYLEVGYAGTYTTLPIYVGNSSVNTTINATSFTGTSNNSLYLGGTAAASYVQNTDSRTLSGNLTLTGANLVVSGTNTYITSNTVFGGGNSAAFYSVNGQANASANLFTSNAYATFGGYGGNFLAFGQQTNFAQWIQSGYPDATTPVYYNIILNPLGGNVGIGNTVPTHKLSINGTTYFGGNVSIGSSGFAANGSYGAAGQSLLSNGSATYWATAGATLNANNTDTQTFYIGLSNASTGAWTNAVVSTTKLYYVPSTGMLSATAFSGNGASVTSVDAATVGGNTASTLRTYTDNKAGNAYSNAVSYTDSVISNVNSAITANASAAYSNATIFASNASNINTGTLAEARLPYRMDQNVRTTDNVTLGNLTLTGNLVVGSNVNVIGANNLSVIDNMIYLNANANYANPDIGFTAGYNDGVYHHTGIFRDASDGIYKVFDNYDPEPDANIYIDTTNTSFHIANFQANTYYAGNTSTNWFIANTGGTYVTGTVNAASHTVGTAFTANSTVVNAVSYYAGTTLIGNTTGPYGKTEGNLNVNSAAYATSAGTANNSTYAFGKTEGNLNVNSATYATSAGSATNATYATSAGSATNASAATNATYATSAGTANTTQVLTFASDGTGNSAGNTFNGGTAKTISYNSVGAPKTDGTGASGTWSISINGSAASATNASAATNATYATSAGSATNATYATSAGSATNASAATNATYATSAGSATNASAATNAGYSTYAAYQSATGTSNDWVTSFQNTPAHSTSFREMSGNGPSGTWWFMENMRHSNSGGYWGRQNAWGWEDNANEYYTRNIQNNSFGSWVRFLNSSNYNSYAPTLTGGNASGTWSINVNGSASSATNATYASSAGSATNGMVTTGNQTITGGFVVSPTNLGTGSGTVTPAPTSGNYQYITNNGAFTLAAPASDCAIDILVTNGASAGTITISGYTAPSGGGGDAYVTTNAYRFIFMIRRIAGVSTYAWKALQ